MASTSGSTRGSYGRSDGGRAPGGLMSPPMAPSSSAASRLLSNRPSFGAAPSVRRPPAPSSTSSSVARRSPTAERASPSSSTRRARIEGLVEASVPSARPRPSETDRHKVVQREEWRMQLVDAAQRIMGEERSEGVRPADASQTIASLKRKLIRHDTDNGQGNAVRLDVLLSKLKRQPDLGGELEGMLEVMQALAFSSNRHAASASSAGSMPHSRSSLLQQPAKATNSSSTRPTRTSTASRDAEGTPSSPLNTIQEPNGLSTPAQPTLSAQDKAFPKAKLLEEWRSRKGQHVVSEAELLRDVMYLLQGINGRFIGFEEDVLPASNDLGEEQEAQRIVKLTFYDEPHNIISAPTKQLVHRISELGRLYRRIDEFHKQQSTRPGAGLIMQSLCNFVSSELTDYYRLVAILEAEMNQQREGGPNEQGEESMPGLTLRRVAVWTEEVTLRMRLLSALLEGCKDKHGGAIVSMIHTFTFYGDPLIQKFTTEILDRVSRPFFHTLSLWIYEGELRDPFHEFFVETRDDLKATWAASGHEEDVDVLAVSTSQEQGGPASSLWQNKYRFRANMLPSFFDETFGRKIFSTGKSLNFIRYGCDDAEWVTARAAAQRQAQGEDRPVVLRYANLTGLRATIDEAYASASNRLLDIFMGRFKLLAHLRALKDYLMLTKGDFTDLLMESLGPSLDRPASSLFRHNMTASLEAAIRGSNGQYDDVDLISRLDARILEFDEADLGWDTFTLEYRVDEPVSTVLDSHAMASYQMIFAYLWKLKRVDVVLGASWEKLLLAANVLRRAQPRSLRRAIAQRSRAGSLPARSSEPPQGDPDLVRAAHVTLGHISEQVHFVRQMQGFIHLECIEYSWNDLTTLFANHAAKRRLIDLDELIAGHRTYLNTLVAKLMLRGSTGSTGIDGKRPHPDQLHEAVQANLDTMLTFAMAVDDLARYLTDEMAKVDLGAERSARGQGAPAALTAIQTRVETHHAKFASTTRSIIQRLERHSNLVVRDLATRLNFNSFYTGHGSSSDNTPKSSLTLPGARPGMTEMVDGRSAPSAAPYEIDGAR